MASHGIKRKRDLEQSDSSNRFHSSQQPLTTESISMEKAKNIMTEVVKKIQLLKEKSETTEFYDNIVKTISNMDKSKEKKRTIGILGHTGEGKTTLLNALLGKRSLLPSGCFGACTAVVTQVEANLTDHNYTAEIELISKEEWETQLQDLLGILKTKSKDKNEDLTNDAREKITALYGVNAETKTFEELKKDDIFAQITKDFSCSEVSEFANKLKHYIQHNAEGTGQWYWPLVKSVKIKIPDCRELLEHIVLVDLPGSGDCNKARADLWKNKLRDCCSVWILSNVQRAVNNKDAWEILNYCIEDMVQAGECREINFICTKSDDIDPEEYNSSLEKKIPEDENQMTNCILHRNDCAKETLKKRFDNSEIKKEEIHIQVFTVSSRAFFNRNLGLRCDDTEIPKLQDALKNTNKRINQELSRNYIKETNGVLSLIQSFQSERRKKMAPTDIQNGLMSSLKKALEKLDCQFDMLRCFLDKGLLDGVEKSKISCLDDAKEIISPDLPQGQRGFHQILQALCRNGGFHKSKAWKRDLDLNKCLAKHMYENMKGRFSLIFHVNAKTGISVQEQIDKFSIIQPDTANPMLQNINKFIKSQEDKLKMELKCEVVNKKKEIYTSVKATFQNAMASSYEEAALETGDGSLKRKQDILTNRIESLNPDIFKNARMEVLMKTNELMDFIKNRMESVLKSVIQYSCAKANKNVLWDVSKEIEELDQLSAQLTENTG